MSFSIRKALRGEGAPPAGLASEDVIVTGERASTFQRFGGWGGGEEYTDPDAARREGTRLAAELLRQRGGF